MPHYTELKPHPLPVRRVYVAQFGLKLKGTGVTGVYQKSNTYNGCLSLRQDQLSTGAHWPSQESCLQ